MAKIAEFSVRHRLNSERYRPYYGACRAMPMQGSPWECCKPTSRDLGTWSFRRIISSTCTARHQLADALLQVRRFWTQEVVPANVVSSSRSTAAALSDARRNAVPVLLIPGAHSAGAAHGTIAGRHDGRVRRRRRDTALLEVLRRGACRPEGDSAPNSASEQPVHPS